VDGDDCESEDRVKNFLREAERVKVEVANEGNGNKIRGKIMHVVEAIRFQQHGLRKKRRL
jgi:hypothetical protein